MADREKVIKGLKCHQIDKDHRINCSDCPYHCDEFMNGLNALHNDALELLQEQEIVRCKHCEHWEKLALSCAGNGACRVDKNLRIRDPDWFCAYGKKKIFDGINSV